MNPKAVIVMLIFAVLLAGLAVYLFTSVATPEERARAERDVFDYKVPQVTRIAAKRGADVVFDISHERERWIYKVPALGDADPGKVLRAISELRFESTVKEDITDGDGPVSLEAFGFSGSRIEVDLYTPGKNYIFQIGNLNATKDGVYLRFIPGDRVILTSKKVVELFDVPATAFKPTTGESPGPK